MGNTIKVALEDLRDSLLYVAYVTQNVDQLRVVTVDEFQGQEAHVVRMQMDEELKNIERLRAEHERLLRRHRKVLDTQPC